jgi:UDP-glucose 4,6-dehydratase
MSAPERLPCPSCVLVTGGLGFIGSFVVDAARRRFGPETRIVILDAFGTAASVMDRVETMADPRVRIECVDLCDQPEVERVIRTYAPELVLHLAAESHVDRSFANSLTFTRSNALGTHVLLEACRRHRETKGAHSVAPFRIVHMSTDEVYGSGEKVGQEGHSPQTSILMPTNPYAASKAAAEMQCMAYVHSFLMDIVVIRCNNVYGPRQYLEKVVPRFVLQAMAGEAITLHGDGKQKRSFLYAGDAAEAVLTVAERARPGEIINVGATEEMTIRDLAARIQSSVARVGEAWDLSLPRAAKGFVMERDRRFNDFCYPVNIDRARELGWEPRTSLDQGLETTILWYHSKTATYFSADEYHMAIKTSGHMEAGPLEDEPPAAAKRARVAAPFASLGGEPAPFASLGGEPGTVTRPGGDFRHPLRVLVFGATGWIGGKLMRCSDARCSMVGARSRLDDPRGVWEELVRVLPDRVVLAAGITGRPNIDWCENNVEETVRVNLEGAVNLGRMCARLGIHLTNFATGCIYTSDIFDTPRAESDAPNFFGSVYSRTKIHAEAILRGNKAIARHCLVLRLRMPLGDDLDHPRNLATKLRHYTKIVESPNSISVLPELLPIAVHMMIRGETGVYNFTNPGFVTPADVRAQDDARRRIVERAWVCADPKTLKASGSIVAERSNCILDASKLCGYAGTHRLRLSMAQEALRGLMGGNRT